MICIELHKSRPIFDESDDRSLIYLSAERYVDCVQVLAGSSQLNEYLIRNRDSNKH